MMGLAEPIAFAFHDRAAGDRVLLLDDERVWINKDGGDVVEVEIVHAENQNAREGGNGDAHLVGQFEPSTSLPFALGQHDLHGVAQLQLLGFADGLVMPDALVQDGLPCIGKRFRENVAASATPEPAEHAILPHSIAKPTGSFYTECDTPFQWRALPK